MRFKASTSSFILLLVFVCVLVASFDNQVMIRSVYGVETEYPVEVLSVETGLGTGASWNASHLFFHGELMSVKVIVMNNAENLKVVRVAVSAFDDLFTPFGFSTNNLTLNPKESRVVYCQIFIPDWAFPGEDCQVGATAEILADGTYSPERIAAFFLLPTEPVHDVSVLDVVPLETEVYVGWEVQVSAIVKNEGNISESFAVICKNELEGNKSTIQEVFVIDLPSRARTQIVFNWTTTNVGVYKVIVDIPVLQNETDTADNVINGSLHVKVKIFGDVNGDNTVNMLDIGVTGLAFGSRPMDPRWNIQTDLNQDDRTNMLDVALVARNFGESWPP